MPARPSLNELFDHGEFARRHIGPTADERQQMLAAIGAGSIAELLDRTVPASIRMAQPLALPAAVSEAEMIAELHSIAAANALRHSLVGMGYTPTITPPVILRNVLESPAWYTAYTPYQPEISQGRLEALINFQTMVADLTGLELANASLLDEATAAAEAMTMARRLSRNQANTLFVHRDTHPQTIAVLATRAEPIGVDVVVGDLEDLDPDNVFGALFSLPTSTGALVDWREPIAAVQAAGGLAIIATDLLACVAITPPGELGADIAVGSAQRFGVPMGFGGPHAGFLAARDRAARSLPGRLVGVSTDTEGRPALRLALQTREQHIRRDKATSNICTAQVLLANIAGFYAAWHGPDGLAAIAERVQRLASITAAGLSSAGLHLVHDSWFDTLAVEVPDAAAVVGKARDLGVDLRLVNPTTVGMTFDETATPGVVELVWAAFGVHGNVGQLDGEATDGISSAWRRTTPVLPQQVFHRYHSEHAMLRYLRRLADRDLALDRTMIPLGSCTMKLNATSEMEAITWPEFANVHPYAPEDEWQGYRRLIDELEAMLVAITGYDAVSLQPNAGSQGEFAGLLAIRAYHRANDEPQRVVCLIPSSAHGTNAASAVMAGMDVVVVACDGDGNVDLDDLRAKAAEHADQLAAVMVTYPSTHGVFEEGISDLCAIVHDHGGQVYVDGANLNALVGLAQPGRFGADVSHLNLHKTFCIPHGGGGPGVGPVAVRAHLASYLPGHPLAPAGSQPVGPVAAAPFGSAGILPISWAYVRLMGASGLTEATEVALLNANYVAARLDPSFPVLYRGSGGFIGHECILDLRPLTKATGVTVDDVAKRLIDFGFHAPTISFPVAGTLMVEPTESESKVELDRFCEAMIAIRAEIDEVAAGKLTIEESPLRFAPHTAADLIGDWTRAYPRSIGAYPMGDAYNDRYFPPVSRIDAAYGDRNLVCSCEPLEALAR